MTKKTDITKDHSLQQRVKKLEEQWKRALADYANLEKRTSRERQSWIDSANEALIDKLLFVFDDLERACRHLTDPGLKIIRDQFWQVLKSEGVEKIITKDQDFDPQLMDAEAVVKGPKEKVINETCSGYLYRGHCLRPAKVEVGQGEK